MEGLFCEAASEREETPSPCRHHRLSPLVLCGTRRSGGRKFPRQSQRIVRHLPFLSSVCPLAFQVDPDAFFVTSPSVPVTALVLPSPSFATSAGSFSSTHLRIAVYPQHSHHHHLQNHHHYLQHHYQHRHHPLNRQVDLSVTILAEICLVTLSL